jgi:hypothetical protein
MRSLFFLLLFLALPTQVFAAKLVVRNATAETVRIDSLRNNCDGWYVAPRAPLSLAPGAEFVLEKTTAVIHTFTVCGGGFCSNSAMGMKENRDYVLEVKFDDAGIIDGVPTPDHWVGSHIECPR